MVEDFDRVLSKVEKPGGTIMVPKNEIKTVGIVAVVTGYRGQYPQSLETRGKLIRENPIDR
jgi:predicted enzyme related to lactoylglutathione lyase